MKIKKKKLLKYLKERAKDYERDAESYSEDGDYARAYEAIIIANFMKDALIEGIKHDFTQEDEAGVATHDLLAQKVGNLYILVDYSNYVPEKITKAKAKELISLGCLTEETVKQDGVRSWYGDTIDGWEYLLIEIACNV